MSDARKYIDSGMNLSRIVTDFPETVPVFQGHGLEKLITEDALKGAGRIIKLGSALKRTDTDADAFVKLLNDAVVSVRECADVTLREKPTDNSLTVAGLLPCPVRLPLLEGFAAKADALGISPDMKLEAASG